jgi:nucleoside-diphosphate-sugar epimerase
MRIFLTGATGYIGSAVLEALHRGGHEVTALVRDPAKAAGLAPRATPVLGNAADPSSYRAAAAGHDGYVLTAFDYSGRGVEVDRTTLETLIPVARAAKARALVYTSGVWVLGNCPQPADEDAPVAPTPHVAWRPGHERLVLEAAEAGFRTLVIRPGIVYGGARGIVSDIFRDAANGLVRVVGSGENHWPLVYDRDLADLYARLVVHPEARGVYHANDHGDERVNDVVAAISRHLTPAPDVRHVPLQEAQKTLGGYAAALVLDQIVRSRRARALGWVPSLHSVAGNVPRLLEEWRSNAGTG